MVAQHYKTFIFELRASQVYMRNNMVDMTIIALSFELWQMLQSKNKKVQLRANMEDIHGIILMCFIEDTLCHACHSSLFWHCCIFLKGCELCCYRELFLSLLAILTLHFVDTAYCLCASQNNNKCS
uniref:Uncharacterized protein n=1 Tax=Rhipicephalus microplus TaxID=6941 RepID=A0A6G5AGD9_RHIMP